MKPTTAVDVVMQRQIIGQILRLRARLGFAVVFVTHDLSLLLELADRIAIMYRAGSWKSARPRIFYAAPRHPYNARLRDSFPPLHAPFVAPHRDPRHPTGLRALPSGCPFHPRCPQRFDTCETTRPELRLVNGHHAACHLELVSHV